MKRLLQLVSAGVLAVALVPNSAAAHGTAALDGQGYGMLTFWASAQLSSPLTSDVATYIVDDVQVTSHSDHFVSITGPANEGGIHWDYEMKLRHGTTALASKTATNEVVGLDVMGRRIEPASLDATAEDVVDGEHTASAEAMSRLNNSGSYQNNVEHQHPYTVNAP